MEIKFKYYFPFLLLMVIWASVQYTGGVLDYVALFIFSLLGIMFKHFKINRAATVIGFILANQTTWCTPIACERTWATLNYYHLTLKQKKHFSNSSTEQRRKTRSIPLKMNWESLRIFRKKVDIQSTFLFFVTQYRFYSVLLFIFVVKLTIYVMSKKEELKKA